ncbi:MAG: class I SAM-dependent methyltransferase, partial [Verrucomicrobiota bacterium]
HGAACYTTGAMNLETFRKRLTGRLRLFSLPVATCSKRFGDEYEQDAAFILSFVEGMAEKLGHDLDTVLTDYLDYAGNQVEEQKAFNQSGRYAHSRFEEVRELVESEDFQQRNIYTLSLSYVLSPYRYQLLRYVRDSVNHHLQPGDRCLEIATGTGIDATVASRTGADIETYDLNPFSQACLDVLQPPGHVHFHPRFYDFDEEEAYDHCLMIELLEHLEQPADYLEKARRVLKPNGTATLTFAMRMPQADHLYLFRSIEEPQKMVEEAGFERLDQDLFVSSFFKENEDKENLVDSPEHAAVYACTVRRKK